MGSSFTLSRASSSTRAAAASSPACSCMATSVATVAGKPLTASIDSSSVVAAVASPRSSCNCAKKSWASARCSSSDVAAIRLSSCPAAADACFLSRNMSEIWIRRGRTLSGYWLASASAAARLSSIFPMESRRRHLLKRTASSCLGSNFASTASVVAVLSFFCESKRSRSLRRTARLFAATAPTTPSRGFVLITARQSFTAMSVEPSCSRAHERCA
mmetsp:Transcript_4081/g.8689  ORF Transcript_4081/g.8689 Transcript_4081/m.8689 type:complete len:216 (-) Transcript_4081:267-914(-)